MKGCLRLAVAFAIFVAIGIYLAFPHPTWNQAKLKAVAAESRTLMATHPITPEGWTSVPARDWPPEIASLQPYSVTVVKWGVHIGIRPFFDGGWGYGVPRNEAERKMLTEWCYSDAGQGVLWHGPC